MLVQLGAQVASHPLPQDRHQPQPYVGRGLAHEVDEPHRRDREPRNRACTRKRQRSRLGWPHDLVDQMARQVRRHQADQRDHRRRRHPQRELPAIWLQVTEQPPDHRGLPAGNERLRLADGARYALRVQAVRLTVRELPLVPVDLLLEHESDVLERAALPVRVTQQRERRIARCAENRQDIGRQAWCFPDRLDTRPFEGPHVPPGALPLGHRDVP